MAENGGNAYTADLEPELNSSLLEFDPSLISARETEAKPPPASAKNKCPKRSSLGSDDDFLNLLHGSDPVKIELNRLQNEAKEKDRELAEAHGEIRGLKLTDRAKDKALAEVTEELEKMLDKIQAAEASIEYKNLEIKRLNDEKKEAMAAQFAAEATLRRVHAAQKDEELPPLEDILYQLEADIKILRQELSKVQDDNRALERLIKSKEVALLDAERAVQFANIKAALVDDLLNKNQELTKQNDICQEEYKILDKMHRQKVGEVEKLGQTVCELEEALLSGAAAANAARDYQRQVSELKGEKKTLERTLSRVKATENRVAVAIANEWKDGNDKVMPVKQWLEERRILMGEMQQLREKLSIAERATKTEAQLKERFQLRLRVVEDGLKSSLRHGIRYATGTSSNKLARSRSVNGTDNSLSPSTGTVTRKSHVPYVKSSTSSNPINMMLKHAKGASKSYDGRLLGEDRCIVKSIEFGPMNNSFETEIEELSISNTFTEGEKEPINGDSVYITEAKGDDDYVSGILYDILQKEVLILRKTCFEKDHCLKDKDNSIEMLSRKIDTLAKAMEVESKKLRREKAAAEKEAASMRVDMEHEQRSRRLKGIIGLQH